MDNQAVLYALSTLAQTCAALAAFVGAVGIFRLQMLRDEYRAIELEFRVLVESMTGTDMMRRRLSEVRQVWLHRNPNHPNFSLADETNRLLLELPDRRSTAVRVLVFFETWHLFVILLSLLGFAYVPVLACSPWTGGRCGLSRS